MANGHIEDVVILGHSFIRRLDEFTIRNNISNLNLDAGAYSVTMRGKGGLRLSHLSQDATILSFPSTIPDICFIQIGENDIKVNSDPLKIATDIVAVAKFLHEGDGVKHVLVGQLLRRLPYVAGQRFNSQVIAINNHLRAMTDNLHGLIFWPHRGFWQDLSVLGPDGVHLLSTPSSPIANL